MSTTIAPPRRRTAPLPIAHDPAPWPLSDAKDQTWADFQRMRLGGRPVVASVSGGKDSTALCLLLKEAEIPFQAVHMATGWEHKLTDEYLRDYLPAVVGPIAHLQGKHGGMEGLIRHKGMFPSRVRRFCTQELKVFPMRDYIRALQQDGQDPINAVGIRAAESKARSNLTEWDTSDAFDCDVWRPLIDWKEEHVIALHKRHGVRPNPLYLQGATRVGCWPCIFARKSEIRLMADLDPDRVTHLEQLEAEVAGVAAARYALRGETFESLGYLRPSWFQDPTSRTDPTTGKRAGGTWPIRKVVEWSRTKRGGREVELLAAPPSEDGCMRWGLCETA